MQYSDEAEKKRAQRRAARHAPSDPLAKRASSAKFWKDAHATNKAYSLVHTHAFFRHPGFIRYLLPNTQSHVTRKASEERARYSAELRESGRRAAHAKALAKATPLPLFDNATL